MLRLKGASTTVVIRLRTMLFFMCVSSIFLAPQLCSGSEINNVFGLTSNEIDNVHKAWHIFKADWKATEEIKSAIVSVTEKVPKAKNLSKSISTIPLATLRNSKELTDLAHSIIQYINIFFQDIKDNTKTKSYLIELKRYVRGGLNIINFFSLYTYFAIMRSVRQSNEGQQFGGAADAALSKVRKRVRELVASLVNKNYFGLTTEELKAIKAAWETVSKDNEMMERLLTNVVASTPNIMKLNPDLNNGSIDSMGDRQYNKLRNEYVTLVNHFLSTLDNYEDSEDFIKQMMIKFETSKLSVLRKIKIQYELILQLLLPEVEKYPKLHSIMYKMTKGFHNIIQNLEKKLPLKI